MSKYIKFRSAKYDKDTGTSSIYLDTDLGLIEGKAYCHGDDLDYASEIFGGFIAEQRAKIKYYKMKKHDLKQQKAAIDKLLKKASLIYNVKDTALILNEQEILKSKIENLNNIIKILEDNIKEKISIRDKVTAKYRKN